MRSSTELIWGILASSPSSLLSRKSGQPQDTSAITPGFYGMMLDGRAQATGIRRPGEDASVLLLFNAHDDAVEFTLPEYAAAVNGRCCSIPTLPTRQKQLRFSPASGTRSPRSLLFFVLSSTSMGKRLPDSSGS
jgi:hypothetical protein